MLWALILSFAMAGNAGAQTSAPAKKAVARSSQRSTQPTPKLLSAAVPSSTEDYAAESALLDLANQRRKEAGVAPLRMDESLNEAARAHARLMVDRQQLSHQFDGEPSLMPRLRESGLQLNQAGENVAYNSSAEQAFETLMQSAPHRQNLLDPDFNSVGIAAVWNEGRLYVVQDFAHQLPKIVPSKQPR
ncbi:MAG: CAP domain-containing protein [Acidobacteriales bacterium]|nr:CAP domain-containing protein [Terriglobales bacterium]